MVFRYTDVRFTSNSVRISAAEGIDAKCQEATSRRVQPTSLR
jgi:hypothetical protein